MASRFDHLTLGQRVLFGTGSAVENTATALGGLGARRAIVISGASAAPLADEIAGRISVGARIREVRQHVPVENADAAAELASAHAGDALLAIGGGSAIGLAKAVARRTALPIVAVPTTFAGSEATNVWGETESGRKVTGTDDRVLPAVVVYDASLTASLPGSLAAASALNAIAHAVDGFWAPRADPINTALGTEGLRALVPGLRRLAEVPGDVEAREQTLYGAYLAAVAFASAGSGMHHKICHVLGGAYGLSHAELHAIVLPYVVAFNAEAAPDAAERTAAALGEARPGAALWRLRDSLGVPGSLAELGLSEGDVADAARLAAEAIPASNPRPVTVDDVEHILRAAWAGEPVE